MPLRQRNGRWHYRFMVAGREYSGDTGLVATSRNETAANRIEAEAHKLVSEGKAHLLKLQIFQFSEGAEKFMTWADGEYRNHPNSAKRIRGSFASLTEFFGRTPVHAITPGDVEDFKSWRRTERALADGTVIKSVADVTVRHDLHNLSLFFQYAEKHNWTHENPVRKIEVPSDAEAVRIHPLSDAEEKIYFADCEKKMAEIVGSKKPRPGGKQHYNRFVELADLAHLMILQGCRPEEFLELEQANVDLERGEFRITAGKSKAARRTLRMRALSREIFARRLSTSGRWVFPSPIKRGAHASPLNEAHDEVLGVHGLHFVIYDFRHTFATRAADAGMPLATLAAILGHGNLRSVLKYVHPAEDSMSREMERLDSRSGIGPVWGNEKGENAGKGGRPQ